LIKNFSSLNPANPDGFVFTVLEMVVEYILPRALKINGIKATFNGGRRSVSFPKI
jgi:hypothetical protein